MLRKRYSALILAATLPGLAGCVQAIRHSNTMVFATTTSFGVKAGASAGETPSINIGYDRQEAVLMPLLANTKDVSPEENHLSPCRVEDSLSDPKNSETLLHPCKFIAAKVEGGKVVYQDSYSVLASFGAKGSGSVDGTGGNGSIGLAQYFATGLAAQELARNGGASVVNTSAISPEIMKNAQENNATMVKLKSEMTTHLGTLSDQDAKTFLQNYEKESGIAGFSSFCGEKAACIASLGTNLPDAVINDPQAAYAAFKKIKGGA